MQVLQKIGQLLWKQLFRCTSEELTHAIWGISFLGPKVLVQPLSLHDNMDALIRDIIQRLLRDISKLRSIDLAVFVEGLARMQYPNVESIMEAVTYEMKIKISRLNNNDVPRFLWSLAQLQYPGRDGRDKNDLLSTLAWECKQRLPLWNGLDLARVVWAFGVLQFKSIQHMLSLICSRFLHRVYLRANAAVKLIWGFNALDHRPNRMIISKLGRSFALDIENLYPRDIATGFLSLLNLGLVDDRVQTRIKELVMRNEVEDWSPRDAANVMWALARADFLEQDTFMILRRFILQYQPDALSHQGQADLYRCYLHMHTFRPSMARLMPAAIGDSCQNAWIETQQQQLTSSPIVSDVLEKLKGMGFRVQSHEALHDGLLYAHTAAKDADAQFAIEIIHPPKCFMNDNSAMSEQQRWREDVLTSWGWKIVRVDEKRWGRLQDEHDKLDLLNILIKRA